MASYTPYDRKEFEPQSPESIMSTRLNVVKTGVYDLLFKASKLPPEAEQAERLLIPESDEVRAHAEKMAKALVTPLQLAETPTPVKSIPENSVTDIRAKVQEALDQQPEEQLPQEFSNVE